MLASLITKLTIFALRSKRLSGEQKSMVTAALLDNLHAFPIADIVTFDKVGNLEIKGKKLDTEQKIAFKESGAALKNSFARRLIHDQIIFKALNIGIHNGINTDAIIFSKAALWILQEEKTLIDKFSNTDEDY